MKNLEKLYYKLPHINNWKFWIAFSLIIKSLFFIFFISLSSSLKSDYAGFNYRGSFGKDAGDTQGYFSPVENLLANGEYKDDFRMPGYGWIYYLNRLFFSPAVACNIILILQLIFSAISVYLLGLVAYIIFKRNIYFYLTFFLYSISPFVCIYDYILMTESLCTSTLIASFYLFIVFFNKRKSKFLFFSGLLITWSIFLRPVILPVFLIFIFFLILDFIKTKTQFKVALKHFLFFLIPFIIIDGAWIYRNNIIYHRFIPLQKNRHYTAVMEGYGIHAADFTRCYGGGSDGYWLPNNEALYFFPESSLFYSKIGNDTMLSLIPEHVYTSKFNRDSLLNLRKLIIELTKTEKTTVEKKNLNSYIANKFDFYKESIKHEKPLLYYAYSRIKSIEKIFFMTMDYNLVYLFGFKNYYIYRLYKLYFAALFYFMSFIGLLGCIVLTFKYLFKINNLKFLLLITTNYLFFVYPLLFLYTHIRYLVTVYPFFVIFTTAVIIWIFKKIGLLKRNNG